jgi:hypothetical protein
MLERIRPIMPSRDFGVAAAFHAAMGSAGALRLGGRSLVATRGRVAPRLLYRPCHTAGTCGHAVHARPEDGDALRADVARPGPPAEAGPPRPRPAAGEPGGRCGAAIRDPDGGPVRAGAGV